MKKKILAICLAFVLCFGMFACNGGGVTIEKFVPEISETASTEVWTMPSTVKLLRDVDYSRYYTATPRLDYDMAKNEYVSMQIMMTPSGDVSKYDLVLSDLVSSTGDVLSCANFEVYNQSYVEVTNRTLNTSGRPLGFYPDALVPMANAKMAKENKLTKNQNQGLWVTIYAPKESVSAKYSGKFSLKIGSKNVDIPVSVVVRDFAIPDKVHAKSTFNMFPEYLAGGQLSNTKDTYEQFVDYMLDYRISTTEIAHNDLSLTDWVNKIKKYAADERVTSYNINSTERLLALIEASTPELNLLEKGYIYLKDEPYSEIELSTQLHKDKIDELISIADSYSVAQLASHGLTKANIEGMEVLITMTASIDTIAGLRTYSPLVSDYNTPAQREKYAGFRNDAYKGKNNELAGKDYGSTWWYVCVHPYEPYPNYNIDMDLVASRVASWMQYDYDVEGMLYWGTATYCLTTTMLDDKGWQNADVYNETNGVYRAANGDGYVVYPGAKYGLDKPIPTIRLMNIRDGFQDYEYLYLLEELANEYASKYKIANFSFDNIMRSIYDSLYSGTVPSTDFELVDKAKIEVANMIELLTSKLRAIVEVGSIDAVAKVVPINVYAKAGSTLTVGGQAVNSTVSGKGLKFQISMPIVNGDNYFKATLTSGDNTKEINRFITTNVKSVTSFDTSASVNDWTKSIRDNGDCNVTTALNTDTDYINSGAGSMKVVAEHRQYTTLEELNYSPYVNLAKDKFLGEDKFSDLDSVGFYAYNKGADFDMELVLSATADAYTRTKSIKSIAVGHGWNYIKIGDIQKINWKYKGYNMLEYVTDIRLTFPLSNTLDYTIYLDDMYYSYKKASSAEVKEDTLKWLAKGDEVKDVAKPKKDKDLVTSFESYQEMISDMKLLNTFGSAKFVDKNGKDLSGAVDSDFPSGKTVVTDGDYALKVVAQGDYKSQKKPSIAIETLDNGGTYDKYDFSDVDKVTLDVHNANDIERNVYFQYLTDSVTGVKLTSAIKAVIPAHTSKSVEFVIDRSFISQLLNLNQICQMRIAFDCESVYKEAYRTFYIDNLRLHRTTDPIDTNVKLRKDNELESADKADYLSVWKTIGSFDWFPSILSFNDAANYIKGGAGSFKLSNVLGRYPATQQVYTIGWELSPMTKNISKASGIKYWVYNDYDKPITDFVRRTIREAGVNDDSKDGLYGSLLPGQWNERTITKAQLIELGFNLEKFDIFTLMFAVPVSEQCDLYIDEIMLY